MTGYTFTDEVRRALQVARERAVERGGEQVTPAHILLGVTSQPGSVCASVLRDLGADPAALSNRVAAALPGSSRRDIPVPADLPYTRLAKQTIEDAVTEARGLGHDYVGTEHVLLALLTPGSPVAGRLEDAGLTLLEARAALLARVPEG